MPTTKNLSPQQLSAMTAAFIAAPIGVGVSIFAKNAWLGLGIFGVIFLGAYWLISYTLEKFIYRKIKLIYKMIHQTKASKREEFFYDYILPPKSIDEVRLDVEEWGQHQLQQIELLKANEAYRKEFLQNLSHEFKTPVFAIQGYIETLLAGALDNKDTAVQFLESASRNVDRLAALLEDVDQISKLESGKQPLELKDFVIQDLIRDVYQAFSLRIQQKNMQSFIKKGCESPLVVHADRDKIKQVLANLVDNAIKYGKINGHIIASIYEIDGRRALIEISDDGSGISEAHLSRIFERFYRTDQARSRKEGGSGLGLAICKHIVEAHGQTIHARSTIDVGTTLGFTLSLGGK